jgi:hypothetical protein
VTLHDLLSTGPHLSAVSFITSLTSNLCTFLTPQDTKENDCILSNAQNMKECQPTIVSTGIYRLRVTNKGRLAFPNANYQGQLQTPQSVSVLEKFPKQISLSTMDLSP